MMNYRCTFRDQHISFATLLETCHKNASGQPQMFVEPFVMSCLQQEHLKLICQKPLILSFSMFTLMEEVTRFSKKLT